MTNKCHEPANLADFPALPPFCLGARQARQLRSRIRQELVASRARDGLSHLLRSMNDIWPVLLIVAQENLDGRFATIRRLRAERMIPEALITRYLTGLQVEGLVNVWDAGKEQGLKCALTQAAFEKLASLFLPRADND